MAIVYAGEVLMSEPATIWAKGSWRVEVTGGRQCPTLHGDAVDAARRPMMREAAGLISPDEELARVMAEIAGALQKSGSALTLPPTGRPAELVYADRGKGLEDVLTALLA